MDIMELGAIGELVGGIAVVVSLIYVGLQLKQGTVATRSNAHQAEAANSTALLLRATDPHVFELLRSAHKNYEGLSEQEQIEFENHYMALFNHWEALYYEYYDQLQGGVHAEIWSSRVRRMKSLFETRPNALPVWRKVSSLFGDSFRVFVNDRILAERSGL